MMHDLLFIGLTTLIFVVPVALGLWWARASNPWRYDERNPYRRYCKHCGTQQDQYQHALGGVSWEYVGTIHDCKRNHEL